MQKSISHNHSQFTTIIIINCQCSLTVVINRIHKNSCENARVLLLLVRQSLTVYSQAQRIRIVKLYSITWLEHADSPAINSCPATDLYEYRYQCNGLGFGLVVH